MNTPTSNRRLQIATRIHYALMRELGLGIDVGHLLKHPLYARDVLLVCDACAGHDLQRLATAFRGLSAGSGTAQPAFDSTGFGLSGFSPSQTFAPSALPSQRSIPPAGWAESQSAA